MSAAEQSGQKRENCGTFFDLPFIKAPTHYGSDGPPVPRSRPAPTLVQLRRRPTPTRLQLRRRRSSSSDVPHLSSCPEARIAGCVTAADAYRFIEQKRTKEAESSACKESGQIGTSAKTLLRPNYLKGELDTSPRGLQKGTTALFAGAKDSPAAIQTITRSLEEWDISGFAGAELLSESEKKLCNEIRVLPSHYLNMLQTMSSEISKGNVTNKSDARTLFKVEPSKVDRVYDMLVNKGVVQT